MRELRESRLLRGAGGACRASGSCWRGNGVEEGGLGSLRPPDRGQAAGDAARQGALRGRGPPPQLADAASAQALAHRELRGGAAGAQAALAAGHGSGPRAQRA
eukprot:88829-Lingulodinium_polyedra.AAC.1